MSKDSFSDEQLMAYADGELDAATAVRVRQAVRADTAIAARVKLFEESRRLLREAYDPVLQEPLPPRLQALLSHMEGPAVAVRHPRRRRPRGVQVLAASLVAVAALSALWLTGHRGLSGDDNLLAAIRAMPPVVTAALDQRPSGEPVDLTLDRHAVELLPLASYASAAGYCREFSVEALDVDRPQSLRALACRDGDRWIARAAVDDAAAAPDGGYHAASGGRDLAAELPQPQALDDRQERALIASGWRQPAPPAGN
jgi:hypothetical protein